ncbi:MAG TPA: hypothetical protein VGC01_04925 [Mucilaginibacter sp.]
MSLVSVIFLFADCKKEAAKSKTATDTTTVTNNGSTNQIPLKNMFGVNVYEWNFLGPADGTVINEANMGLIQSFSAVRHYMDWQKLEYTEGNYTFNPTYDGGWSYDAMYTRCKQAGILVLADLKNTPPWLVDTYPVAAQEVDVVPIAYGANKSDPASYIKQAKAAFQFAARYGANIAVDKTLVTVNTTPAWTGQAANQVKIGLGLVKYIECNNEEDKWWEEIETQQTPEEYAANMSAFYDGNMGKLGKNVGVKNADPNMIVVMGGLASNDPTWVTRMINWCKTNRGYKADGSVNLCFDVINYHYYPNVSNGGVDAGVAPELSQAGTIADSFVSVANSMATHPEVWITESGYDINQASDQHAIAIGSKSVLITQADWILRSALLYMRHGLARSFFYQLFDDTPNGTTTYQTSGLAVEGAGRRPAADYILQTTKLMGTYTYVKTISTDPLVDQYQSGSKTIYVLMIPDQKGRTGTYTLTTANNNALTLYNLKVGADAMTSTQVTPANNKLTINVSETPVFVGN